MKSQNNIYFAILIGIILVMGYFMIFSSPETVVEEFDEGPLREEIRLADSTSIHWKLIADSTLQVAEAAKHKADSLEEHKPDIKKYYDEKYDFNANASLMQLDSVIRANW